MPRELFVAKIPQSVSADALKELFEQTGKVTVIKRPRDLETGELKSFAFITMESDKAGEEAIQKLNGYSFEGQAIVVRESDKPFNKPAIKSMAAAPQPPSPPPPPIDIGWMDRTEFLEDLIDLPGTAVTAKVTLVGRPETVEIHQNTVMIILQHFIRRTGYPKGVPTPPDTPTNYMVFISLKQWNKVAESLEKNPDDTLVIEGQITFDPDIPGVSVFATGVNTRLMQQAIRMANEKNSPATED